MIIFYKLFAQHKLVMDMQVEQSARAWVEAQVILDAWVSLAGRGLKGFHSMCQQDYLKGCKVPWVNQQVQVGAPLQPFGDADAALPVTVAYTGLVECLE